MATESQIIANRRNAQKSTGPHTPHGKAEKHGLSARRAVISSESQADFDLYRGQILTELAPESPMESILAERIVNLSWRLKRVCRIQNQTIDALSAPDTSSPFAKLTQSLFSKGQHRPLDLPSESAPNLHPIAVFQRPTPSVGPSFRIGSKSSSRPFGHKRLLKCKGC